MTPLTADVRVNPSDETIQLGPLAVRFLITGDNTSGSVALFELTVPAAQLSTRHTSITHWLHKKRWNQTAGWHLVHYNDSAHLRDIDAPARIPWADLGPRSRASKG